MLLAKGADWLIESAQKIGLAAGLSPFIIGVTIVGAGTSLPEVVSSLAGAIQGIPEVVAANVVGSNIANILLIVGISAIVGRTLVVTKNIIDIDLPLLAIATVLLLGVLWDGTATFGESVLLIATYGIYLAYTIIHRDGDEKTSGMVESSPRFTATDLFWLVCGLVALSIGAKYLIDALVILSSLLNVATGVIAVSAVAVGTSFPELFVSVKAAYRGNSDVALGNIVGSNVFNAFIVMGLPGLFYTLPVDPETWRLGLPYMAAATLLFVISGISRRVHMWEGAFYLALYILFVAKLFEWF